MNTLCILISPIPSLLSKEASGAMVSAFCYEAWGIWYNLVVDRWAISLAGTLQLFLPFFVK